jgi:hypothetical protein
VRSAIISAERGTEALTDLLDFPLTRYPHFVLLPRIWQMRHGLTAYDAAYLALAEALVPHWSHETVRWQERAPHCGLRWYEANGTIPTRGFRECSAERLGLLIQ